MVEVLPMEFLVACQVSVLYVQSLQRNSFQIGIYINVKERVGELNFSIKKLHLFNCLKMKFKSGTNLGIDRPKIMLI